MQAKVLKINHIIKGYPKGYYRGCRTFTKKENEASNIGTFKPQH